MEERVGNRVGVAGFLSERMLRTAGFVSRGNRTADVGCDHAYTSIYLIEQGIAPRVIAMDVNAGPLARAKENVRKFGVEETVDLRLSDGLAKLLPGEADTVLIAGMGGPLMERILTAHPETVAAVKELVLQPQSEIAEFRRFVQNIGFRITEEDMLFEDGKYYTILRAEHGTEELWTEEEYLYGKRLKETALPVLREFLTEERRKMQEVLAGLSAAGTEKAEGRKEELLLRLAKNEIVAEKLAK
ncbi:MAG: SAM-dependent methyltransferase [Lachnospiraceae bacterium]|nr:SAM-dependent methyltransferase [Lachnospiraceae bacterium]